MTTSFPSGLDSFPTQSDLANDALGTKPHSGLHANEGDAIAALEAKVGVDSSAVTTSLDYRVGVLEDRVSVPVDFTTDPGLALYVLNQPTGIEQLDPSIVSGRYRLTAPSTNTDVNLRLCRTAGVAGVGGNTEVRSTWYAQSTAMADSHSRFQPGHCHRVTAAKQVSVRSTSTTSTSTTLVSTGSPGWTSNQYAGGAPSFYVEYYVTIPGGIGVGQTRRIKSNTSTTLTVTPAWDTTPDTSSLFEIWSYNVRAITWSQNIAFAAHALINCHVWDGSGFLPLGQVDMSAYLKPGGVYVQFPWHVKTKVEGLSTSIAIWKDGDPETAYGTSGKSGSFTLPAGFDTPGQSGLYLGHMAANDWLTFEDLSVAEL